MTKPDHFRQAGPHDQLIAALFGLEGHFSNLEDDIITIEQFIKKAQPFLDDIKTIGKWLPLQWNN